jgi:uncharacterized membrane protein YfcA
MSLPAFTAETLVLIGLVYFLAGLVKGVVGLGLPSVAVGLGAVVVGMKPAVVLLLLPSFVTNVWQAVVGGSLGMILRRTWPMMVTILIGTWLGVMLLARLDVAILSTVLGLTLMGYAAMGFTRPELPHPGRHERLLSLPVGLVHGLVAGMTGSYVPGVPFLQSLGLAKDVMVQAMGVLFTASTIALAIAMADQRLLSWELAAASAGAVLPALAGMWVGQRLRRRLSEARFKQALFAALMALGAYILWRVWGV